jgi:hypothetical protein
MLMQWGTERADREGRISFLICESGKVGFHVEKNGR